MKTLAYSCMISCKTWSSLMSRSCKERNLAQGHHVQSPSNLTFAHSNAAAPQILNNAQEKRKDFSKVQLILEYLWPGWKLLTADRFAYVQFEQMSEHSPTTLPPPLFVKTIISISLFRSGNFIWCALKVRCDLQFHLPPHLSRLMFRFRFTSN